MRIVTGTSFTALANLLFALITTQAPYWAFGFPAAIVSVFGADFVFSAGSLFVAKVSLHHEQSVSGALLQTMLQVRDVFPRVMLLFWEMYIVNNLLSSSEERSV